MSDASDTAFSLAQAGGVIDTFLAMPNTRDGQSRRYETIRRLARDEGTQAMEMPAEYMFKDVPHLEDGSLDPVGVCLAEMAKHRISTFLVGVKDGGPAVRALEEYPQHFVGFVDVDPNEGIGALRKIDAAVQRCGDSLKSVHVWGTGVIPQVPLDDKRMYPIYAKCIEIGRPIILYAGVPGPRIPMAPQLPMLLDEVCWFWPDLQIVVRHGGEPWTDVLVKLMLKYPGLHYSTSAFAPKYYPEDVIRFANTRGADKVMYAGYFSAGLSLDRIFGELPDVPFNDDVWPKFLRDNAARVFDIPIVDPPEAPS